MPDHTALPHDEPATEPAHPQPAATARTVAAGVLYAALSAGLAASLVMLIAAFRLLGTNDVRLDLGGLPAVLLAVGFAAASAAALLFLTRQWAEPRVPTVLLAIVVSIAWPLSGIPIPAGLLAIVAVGLALSRDRRCAGGARVAGPNPIIGLTIAAAALAIAGAATATTHPAFPRASQPLEVVTEPDESARAETAAPADGAEAESADAATPARSAAETTSAGNDTTTSAGAETPERAAAETTTNAGTAPETNVGTAPETNVGTAPETTTSPGAEQTAPVDEAPSALTETPGATPITPEGTPASPVEQSPAPVEEAPSPPAAAAPALPTATPAPGDTPAQGSPPATPTAGAASFVRAYYRALDEKRFEDAWKSLSPAVRTRFGRFAAWKAGYGKTLYSKPRDIVVTPIESGVAVKHRLVARDEGCGADREFTVTWRLRRVSEQWSVTALSAVAAGANAAKCR